MPEMDDHQDGKAHLITKPNVPKQIALSTDGLKAREKLLSLLRDKYHFDDNTANETQNSKNKVEEASNNTVVHDRKRKYSTIDGYGYDGSEIFRHDPNTEPRPPLPIFHPSFARSEQLAIKTVEILLENVSAFDQNDDDVQFYRSQLEEVAKTNYTDRHIIGLVGDSGVGRSSDGFDS
jgi:hypothetical protein